MANAIVSIDLDQLEREIKTLRDELDLKVALRNYILERYKSPISVIPKYYGGGQLEILTPDSALRQIGISDWIVNLLTDMGPRETKEIIEAYSSYLDKPYESVRNNVSNALTRLKDAGRIEQSEGEGRGSVWSVPK